MPNDEYEPNPFKCSRCGWILGESYREPNERVTRLRVYVQARAPESGFLGSGLLVYYSIMGMNDGVVVCRHCQHLQSWYANQPAVEEMLARKAVRREKVRDVEKVE